LIGFGQEKIVKSNGWGWRTVGHMDGKGKRAKGSLCCFAGHKIITMNGKIGRTKRGGKKGAP
jgi:hypothetical protein